MAASDQWSSVASFANWPRISRRSVSYQNYGGIYFRFNSMWESVVGANLRHTLRTFVQSPVVSENNVLVKLEMKNVFNTVRRYHWCATTSYRVIGNETIFSETGVHQCDPLGPVVFALAFDELVRSDWKLLLRGRITCRHCRQPKLPNFLYLSNTTSWRLMRRANNKTTN